MSSCIYITMLASWRCPGIVHPIVLCVYTRYLEDACWLDVWIRERELTGYIACHFVVGETDFYWILTALDLSPCKCGKLHDFCALSIVKGRHTGRSGTMHVQSPWLDVLSWFWSTESLECAVTEVDLEFWINSVIASLGEMWHGRESSVVVHLVRRAPSQTAKFPSFKCHRTLF